MEANLQWIITFAAVCAAIIALYTHFSKLVRFLDRQKEQDKEILIIKKEQRIIINGMLACLKGLQEKGCNGPVTQGILDIQNYLNEQAHS